MSGNTWAECLCVFCKRDCDSQEPGIHLFSMPLELILQVSFAIVSYENMTGGDFFFQIYFLWQV